MLKQKNKKKLSIIGLLMLIVFLLSIKPSIAIHQGIKEGNINFNCYYCHNSKQDMTLKRETIHDLCLECHADNGPRRREIFPPHYTTAPKIYQTTSNFISSGMDFSTIGAGGNFSSIGEYDGDVWTLNSEDSCGGPSLGRGHSLGCKNVTPPGSANGPITDFSCTNCHDPHGTMNEAFDNNVQGVNKFRHLRVKPLGAGGGMKTEATGVLVHGRSYVGAISNTTNGEIGNNYSGINDKTANHYWPVVKDSNNMNAYYGGDSGEDEIANWCAQCHDEWLEDLKTGLTDSHNINSSDNGKVWRHPVNNILANPMTASKAGFKKFDKKSYNAPGFTAKLPVAQGEDYESWPGPAQPYYADDTSKDRIFCLSCHMVHGSPYKDNLRWKLLKNSGCHICHNNKTHLGNCVGCHAMHNSGSAFHILFPFTQ